MKIIILQDSLTCLYFPPANSRHSLQYLVLEHPRSMLFSLYEKTSFKIIKKKQKIEINILFILVVRLQRKYIYYEGYI